MSSEAIESGVKIFDPHAHIGAFTAIEPIIGTLRRKADFAGWRTAHPDVWRKLVAEKPSDNSDALVAAMDKNGVQTTLVQPTPNVSVEFVRRVALRHPGRLVPMAQPTRWPVGQRSTDGEDRDPHADNYPEMSGPVRVAERAEYYVRELGLRAFGELNPSDITREIDPVAIVKDFDPLMEVLAQHRLPMQILTAWTQFPGAVHYGDPIWVDEIANRHPNVPIVLTKMGRGIGRYFEGALVVAMRNRNVYLDTSGTIRPHLQEALDVLGPDRIMFATDWTYTWRYMTVPADIHTASLELIASVALDPAVRQRLLSGTVSEVFAAALASAGN